ncbi:hypothetical protein QAD02_009767 [Eretmocerus hayati]|uniref:Uncharacterized protein n=1 Tax=Eretmocerus hayati TaxID=131215 RepID=A0ACC2NCP8_9HYME|nr:hypothetical protein QAD02_009767 [Eretmocerus hayati]
MKLNTIVPNFEAQTTQGIINFYDWQKDSWVVLSSHPADFTPVCTTELGRFATHMQHFVKRNAKLIALSVDTLEDHVEYLNDIKNYCPNLKGDFPYPIIADPDRNLAVKLDMIDEETKYMKENAVTVRALYIISPDHRLRLSMIYPNSTGRNIDEVLRVIDSLQLFDGTSKNEKVVSVSSDSKQGSGRTESHTKGSTIYKPIVESTCGANSRSLWIFGYGSLIWKADFPYERKLIGHIKGFIRRFYQKSSDHRGVPSKPGRVVTLLASHDPQDEVWGCAYKISPEDAESVSQHLDYREREGYTKREVLFYPKTEEDDSKSEPPFRLSIYVGSEDNPDFAGFEDVITIAEHVAECSGGSGSNAEYVYKLADSMRSIAPEVNDEHLFELEDAVRKIEDLKLQKTWIGRYEREIKYC